MDAYSNAVALAIVDSPNASFENRARFLLALGGQLGITMTPDVVTNFVNWLTARDAHRVAAATEPHLTVGQLTSEGWDGFSDEEMRAMAAIAAQS